MKIHTSLDLSQEELHTVVQENHKVTYKLLLSTFASSFIWPSVSVAVAWDSINHKYSIFWLLAVALVILVRLYVLFQWYKPQQTDQRIQRWENAALGLTFAISALWGLAMYSIDINALGSDFNFLSIIIFALISASIGLACYWVNYFWMFTVPMIVFYASSLFFTAPTNQYPLIAATLVFAFYLRQIVYTYHSNIVENILLRERVEHMAEDLEHKKDLAEELAESRKNFLASASHDLRQPLQAMNLFLSALKPYIREPDSQTIFGKMEASTEGMNELLSRILDISKLDSNTLNLNITTFDINTVIANLEQEFGAHAEKHKLDMNVNSISARVTNDAVLVQRILSNLLANAINYTIQGSINIDCHIVDKNIVIDIIDTGPGIADEQQKFIFDEFYQVGNLERDRKKGLGLGLSIVKRLSSILDIELSFESRLGEGSRFSISLAQEFDKPISIEPATVSSNWTAANSTILIIDDEDAVLDGLETLFQQWHFGVLVANSAKDAVDILQSTEQRPDLIISDYRLCDGLNGVDAIQDVKDFLQDQDIPSVIISGDTAPERLSEVAQSGYILLHKPVKPAFLRAAVQRLLA